MTDPQTVLPDWQHQYRIVSSEYPPINFFESLVDPELMDALFHVESLTNDVCARRSARSRCSPSKTVSGPVRRR